MANLYNRQGRTLSVQPVNAEVKPLSLEPITGTIIKRAAEVAQDNYALGNSIALHESLDNVYEQCKDSPEQFNKLADSTIKSFADKMPSVYREKLLGKFNEAKLKYLPKVEQNYYNKLDTELTDNVYKSSELLTNDMLSQANTGYSALINGDDENAKIAFGNYRNAQKNLQALSETKNMKGDYIYNASERKSAQNTQTGQMEAFEKYINTLSKDELKKLDEEKFQDRALWQQITGVDDKTYDQQDKYIKGRRQALGDEEKRVIKNQAAFAATRVLSTRDTEVYDELKKSGIIPKEVFDSIDNVLKTAPSTAKVQNAFLLETTLKNLYDEIGAFDPRFDDADNILNALTRFGATWQDFSEKNGLDQQQQQEVIDIAQRYIADKVFRDAAKNLFEDTAISVRLQQNSSYALSADKMPQGWKKHEISFEKKEILNDKARAERLAQETAHQYVKLWTTYAMAGDYDNANKILQEGNRAVIIAANSDMIPEGEFHRMERDLSNGKPAYYTMLDGRTIQFIGYSNKDGIFKLL